MSEHVITPGGCRLGVLLVLMLLGVGCAHYATPGRGANMALLGVSRAATDDDITRLLDKPPLASFPAGVAVARVQAPGYRSYTAQGWGHGAYCIVTTRDIERDEHFERLAGLPMVRGIAPLNRILLPGELNSDRELRQAAAMLHADVLLVYTIDTVFRVQDKAAPLSVITLGLSPNQQAQVVTTASAALLDTRNGYVYGVCEASESRTQLTSAWTSDSAVDDARRAAETAAFQELVDELDETWRGAVAEYAQDGALTSDPAKLNPD
jgi:hypothetical protein